MKRIRVAASAAVLAALVGVFLFVPLPFHVACNFDVKPRDATTVYASVAGRLDTIADRIEPGVYVEKGAILAQLENVDLEMSVAALEGQLREMDAEVKVLAKQQRFDESAGLRINEIKKQRAALVEVLTDRIKERERLTIRAPVSGFILPVADKSDRQTPEGQLPGWVGGALEAKNLNAFMAPSDRICQIGAVTALASGTCQAGSTSTTAKLADAETFLDDELNGTIINLVDDKGVGLEARVITDYTASGDVATVTPAWTTTPDNTSRYVIVNVLELVAEIIIDQVDVEMVREAMARRREEVQPGVPVDLMLDSLPGQTYESEVERVALAEMTETPLGLSTQAGGDVDSVADPETGMPKPLSTSYPAIAELPYTGGDLQLGMRGKAKLYTGWQPLGRRVYRLITRTFHFEF